MVSDIRDSFKNALISSSWMDEETRISALDKINTMLPLVAFPDLIMDRVAFEQFYDGVRCFLFM